MNTNTLSALEITGIGIIGIFLFMIIFYFAIKIIDRAFPPKND
ncbi:MAG: OadG-related small transporter subunit [Niabella sp.]